MFKMHCDRCGRIIKQVTGPEAKTISLDGDVTCKACKTSDEKLDKAIEKLRRDWERKINSLVVSAKKDIEKLQSE